MKNRLTSALLLLGCLTMALPQISAQEADPITCGKTNKTQQVLILNGDLMKFARENYAVSNIPHLEQPEFVKLSRTNWQLIAFTSDHSKVFSFALEKEGRKLLLRPTAFLNICPCEPGQSFNEIFIVEDGKPIGCKGGNHTIAGRG